METSQMLLLLLIRELQAIGMSVAKRPSMWHSRHWPNPVGMSVKKTRWLLRWPSAGSNPHAHRWSGPCPPQSLDAKDSNFWCLWALVGCGIAHYVLNALKMGPAPKGWLGNLFPGWKRDVLTLCLHTVRYIHRWRTLRGNNSDRIEQKPLKESKCINMGVS